MNAWPASVSRKGPRRGAAWLPLSLCLAVPSCANDALPVPGADEMDGGRAAMDAAAMAMDATAMAMDATAIAGADLSVGAPGGDAWDLSSDNDLAPSRQPDLLGYCAPHDLGGATCDQLGTWAFDWTRCHTACRVDADCQFLQAKIPPCNDSCQYSANPTLLDPYLDALDKQFAARCLPVKCACVGMATYPACVGGTCGWK